MKFVFLIIISFSLQVKVSTQTSPALSKVWVPDNGDGTYKNPVINADYSDPDVVRVGQDYYLISSSFNHVPGLPILHSKDLVNWTIIGHVLQRQLPLDHFSKVQHGNGVWAPSIRYHNNEFYIYYPDPDFGIYLIKSTNILGPWSEPVLVEGGKGLIDPCPLWDDNGKTYLVHAFAGSRAGIKSILVIKKLNAEGTKTLDAGVMVYDGHGIDPTIEGPKIHKRNGYYYIFAPAGGVSTGWQLVLRSKNIYGPYERKVVMDQGTTQVNGPHQGAWIETPEGENWFMHFQDKDAYGRVVHLQPMKWVNDWPVIGIDKDGDGKGEPVMQFKKPTIAKNVNKATPADTDEFNGTVPGLQWQWQANPQPYWAFSTGKELRMYAYPLADTMANYWNVPNLLLQKLPADEFTATVKLSFHPILNGEKAGLIIFGMDYASLGIEKRPDASYLVMNVCHNADKAKPDSIKQSQKLTNNDIYLRIQVKKQASCQFSFSMNEKEFTLIGDPFIAKPGRWVGAKIGLFVTGKTKTNDAGYADFDWFRIHN